MSSSDQKKDGPQIKEGSGQVRRDKFWIVIAVIVAITVLTLVIKERKFGGNENTNIYSPESSQQEQERKPYNRKVELQLSQGWTDRISVGPNESIYLWRHGTPGVEAETDSQIVDYDAGERMGQLRWVRFRVKEGSGVVSVCKVPKGEPDSLCE